MNVKSLKWSLIVVAILLVIMQFVLGLLTNYASETVPSLFTQYPWLVGCAIGIVLVVLVGLVLVQLFVDQGIWPRASAKTRAHTLLAGDDMTGYKYDVFVSYSHKNSDWVHGVLVPRLEKHGFSVFTDAHFKAGAFGPQQMEDGVKKSRRVIAVFTPDYFGSDWTTLENVMAQILDPAAKKRKLIPVLRQSTDVPLRLAGIHWRDLRTESDDEWERLVEDLM